MLHYVVGGHRKLQIIVVFDFLLSVSQTSLYHFAIWTPTIKSLLISCHFWKYKALLLVASLIRVSSASVQTTFNSSHLRSFHYSLYVRCILSWGRALGPLGGLSTGQLNCCLPRMEEKREEMPPRLLRTRNCRCNNYRASAWPCWRAIKIIHNNTPE